MKTNDALVELLIELFRSNQQLVEHPKIYELAEAIITFQDCSEGAKKFFAGDEIYHSPASGYATAYAYFFEERKVDNDKYPF